MKKSCNNRNLNQTNAKNEIIKMTEKEKLVLILKTGLVLMCGMNMYTCFYLDIALIKSINFGVVFLILAILLYRTAMREIQKKMPVLFAVAFLLGIVVMAWIGFLWNKNGIVIVLNAEIPVTLFMRFAEYRWNNR